MSSASPILNGTVTRNWRALGFSFLLGALLSTGVGGWLTWGIQTGIEKRMDALEVRISQLYSEEQNEIRATAGIEQESSKADRELSDRIATQEGRAESYNATLTEMRSAIQHLGAIDGRLDEFTRQMQALNDRHAAIQAEFARLVALAGGKKRP